MANQDLTPIEQAAFFSEDVELLATPGYMGFRGGVMNPSIVKYKGRYLILAKGVHCHWKKAFGLRAHLYLKGAPLLFELDLNFRLIECRELSISGYPNEFDFAIEDFRLFLFRDEVYVSHPLMVVEKKLFSRTYKKATQVLAKVDFDSGCLNYWYSPCPEFGFAPVEKNWLFFEQENHLLFIYSLSPFVVCKDVSGSEKFEIICSHNNISLRGFSLSAGPVVYDSSYYLIVVHRHVPFEKSRLYYQWGVLIDRATLEPRYISSHPIFAGGKANGDFPGIFYIMGISLDGESIVFTVGESDSHSGFLKIGRSELDSIWNEII